MHPDQEHWAASSPTVQQQLSPAAGSILLRSPVSQKGRTSTDSRRCAHIRPAFREKETLKPRSHFACRRFTDDSTISTPVVLRSDGWHTPQCLLAAGIRAEACQASRARATSSCGRRCVLDSAETGGRSGPGRNSAEELYSSPPGSLRVSGLLGNREQAGETPKQRQSARVRLPTL